ncbi:dihydroxy-acid/6-phosphogluconate dehydratase [Microdochium bolleyi]|uniref:Dihydroxy-acid/6-phosphogluconate dehydratase n=1 Tax=Microdochium bolleyi TaxID=196109 RepID=A0A136J0I0_9PEZI|nr:dihydroxy-acid/6-phosphogluconate dehydratase [Microdochium bolleyi]
MVWLVLMRVIARSSQPCFLHSRHTAPGSGMKWSPRYHPAAEPRTGAPVFLVEVEVGAHIAYTDYDLTRPLPSGAAAYGLRQSLPGYGDPHFALFLRKAFIKALGFSEASLSRPIVGIVNTYSAFNPCHANAPQLVDAVKRGVHLAGGLAMEFPTISVHESFASPTSMFLRNLMSMDTEEMVRAQPVDSVVLVGGCDKTVPAQLMGAISADKPAVHLVTGPMMPGSHGGKRVGACTDCRSHWAAYRAGAIDVEDIAAVNDELAPTAGTCGVMGTASTMACILVALGMMPLNGATPPAVSAARLRVAEETGRLAATTLLGRTVAENNNINNDSNNDITSPDTTTSSSSANPLRPQSLLTRQSFLNAITVLQATGGSTNAIVHLMAIIGRHPSLTGPRITLDTVDAIGRTTPLLVDLKPSGDNYMLDLHRSGGMPALLHELRPLLHLDATTVTGRNLGQELDLHMARQTPVPRDAFAEHCIHPLDDPIYPSSSLVVLKGNLCPAAGGGGGGGGAVMKASASKNRRLITKFTGRAVVFTSPADLAARIDSPDLDVDGDSVLVLQGIGPKGNPGMPESGLIPIPRKLSKRKEEGGMGVTDMLRISDGRMSGTAGGSVVLHVSPEAADLDSVLGVVQDGDLIYCDVESRVLRLEVEDGEIRRRQTERRERLQKLAGGGGGDGDGKPPEWMVPKRIRGYRGLFIREVLQAEEGCDFAFLRAAGPAGSGDQSGGI